LAMLRAGKQVQWTELQSSIVYNNFDLAAGVDTNIAYPDGTDPNFPSGNDTDMVAWFNTAGWKNSTMTPGIDNCFDPLVMRGAPTTPLTTNAATPPNDGFFDTTAAYIGAFRDTHDDWATGNWVVWDDK